MPARMPPSSPLHSTAPVGERDQHCRDEAREDADAAEKRGRALVPPLAARLGDETAAEGEAEESPENGERDGERRDRDDRIHSPKRVVERPAALHSARCLFTPM